MGLTLPGRWRCSRGSDSCRFADPPFMMRVMSTWQKAYPVVLVSLLVLRP
jgi:hypothetical protein